VPITTKNNVDQAGTHNTGGIQQSKDNLCAEDSPLVANLKAAGAVVVGRSNVPAFSFRWFTDTDLHGRTLNPHGASLSPGGSSGGAGAAVAAGYGPVAHGNDIGGSIRFPAYACGVVGLRPTIARVPAYTPSGGGMRALTSQLISTDGPLARTVEDCRITLNAMAKPDPRDPQNVPMPEVEYGLEPTRVALFRGSSLGQPAPETDAALTRAGAALEAAGCVVEEHSLPQFEQAYTVWQHLVFHAIAHHYLKAIRASGDRALIHNIDTVLEMTPEMSGGDVADLWAQRVQIMRAWSLFLADWPIVLMPNSYRHGLKIDADQGDRASLERLFHDQSPLLATALTGTPGLSVPTGLAADGAPTGVQLLARWWDEGRLLSAGRIVEAAMPPVGVIDPKG
jgi:amidase